MKSLLMFCIQILTGIFLCGCLFFEPKGENAHIMDTKQISFSYKNEQYFVYSTYLGLHCKDEWFKILSEKSFKMEVVPKCELGHYFIISLFANDDIKAASVNKKAIKLQKINNAKILNNFSYLTDDFKSYLIIFPKTQKAKVYIELLLSSGQFVSLSQQILSKSLFFHQED